MADDFTTSSSAAYACSSAGDFPFVFYDTNNEAVNGTFDSTGSCIFPTANCDPSVSTNECCSLNPNGGFGVTGSNYMLIAWSFFMVPLYYAMYSMYQNMTPEQRESENIKDQEKKPRFITHSSWMPNCLKSVTLFWYGLGVWGYFTAVVVVPIFAKQTQQLYMSVIERNTLAASEAFWEPFKMIFTFVEEIITIRVSYAMSRNDKEMTDRLIHAGIAGVIITGIFGGIVGTFLGVIPATLNALTTPGIANDLRLYPGCSYIENAETEAIIPYWMMESWGLMGRQIGFVMMGFFFGALEFNIFGWFGIISISVYCGVWFGNVATYPNPLTLLGIAEFAMDWTLPFFLIGFMVSPLGAQIRERT